MGITRPMPEYDPTTESYQIDPTTTSMASLIVDLPRGKLMDSTRKSLRKGENPHKRLRRADAPALESLVEDSSASSIGTPTQTSATSQAFSDAPSSITDSNNNNTNGSNAGEDSDNPLEEDHDNTIDPSLRYNDAHADADDYADLNNIRSASNHIQMRLDQHRRLVVDESTVNIERPTFEEIDHSKAKTENSADALINSSTWLRKRAIKRVRWSHDATDRFYELYRQHGDDYEIIAKRMKRDRKQIKSKAMNERKTNANRMNHARQNPSPVDPEELKRDLGIDISLPVPDDPVEALQNGSSDKLSRSVAD